MSDRDKYGIRFLYVGKIVEDPILYLIGNDGGLYWYKHAGFATGGANWYGGRTNKVGVGWNSAKQVFSTGWGNKVGTGWTGAFYKRRSPFF